ncbi:uncharacterized protein LOC144446466 [Glandiceps talaboti]
MLRYVLLLVVQLSIVILTLSCQPPDCDRPDCGTCGNACCTLDFYFEKQPEDMYTSIVTNLQEGGPDGRYSFVAGSDLRKYNVSAQFLLQGQHMTLVHQYIDTMNMAFYYGDDGKRMGTLLHAFSISNIAGALCDAGQNYKNLVGFVKALGVSFSEKLVSGCPKQ